MGSVDGLSPKVPVDGFVGRITLYFAAQNVAFRKHHMNCTLALGVAQKCIEISSSNGGYMCMSLEDP